VKGAGERALAHQSSLGECGNRELLVEVAGDPCLEFAQLGSRLLLGRERAAELGLATQALEEHH
jgi:hypothetical protein